MPSDQRFRKYQWVDLKVSKAKDDPRAESFHLEKDSIRVLTEPLSTKGGWRLRKEHVLPLKAKSLCDLKRERDENQQPTLGLIRPSAIQRLRIEKIDERWTDAQLAMLRQKHFFEEPPKNELEKIPYKFHYSFNCEDADCNGHNLMCTDWEMSESYRQWRSTYSDAWEEKFRFRYETEMISRYDTHFFVGTVASHPGSWIIIGLFYPPHERQSSLF